jgi:hypothetical protein
MHAECSGGGWRGRGGGGRTTAERSGVKGRGAEDLRDTNERELQQRAATEELQQRAPTEELQQRAATEDLRDTNGRLPAKRVALKIVYPVGSWTPTHRVKSAVISLQKPGQNAGQNAGAPPPLEDKSASGACCALPHEVDSELRALLSPLKYAASASNYTAAGALSFISLIPLSTPTLRKSPEEEEKVEDKVCMFVCVCARARVLTHVCYIAI